MLCCSIRMVSFLLKLLFKHADICNLLTRSYNTYFFLFFTLNLLGLLSQENYIFYNYNPLLPVVNSVYNLNFGHMKCLHWMQLLLSHSCSLNLKRAFSTKCALRCTDCQVFHKNKKNKGLSQILMFYEFEFNNVWLSLLFPDLWDRMCCITLPPRFHFHFTKRGLLRWNLKLHTCGFKYWYS